MCRYLIVLRFIAILAIASLSLPYVVQGETHVGDNVDTRTYLAFRVNPDLLKRWVPEPLQITPIAAGPYKDANLFVVFYDRISRLNAEGKPDAGGNDRGIVLAVPAKQPQAEKPFSHVIRGYTANAQTLPGPYKNTVQASVRYEQTLKAVDLEPGTEELLWEVKDSAGGKIEFNLRCQRGLPTRAKFEQKFYSAADPNFFRIYRIDSGTDVIKNVSAGVDRVQNYQFKVTMAELRELFDGKEQLVTISILPWFMPQVFLP